jgi:hypothetical protein
MWTIEVSVWTDMLTQIRIIFYIVLLFIFVEMKPAFFAILGTTGSIGNSEILKFNVVKTNTGTHACAMIYIYVKYDFLRKNDSWFVTFYFFFW